MDTITNLAREHAWKYFEIHAQQRMVVFNFYLAITGLLAAGIGVSLQQGGGFSYIVTLLSIFLCFVSILFWKLDQRVSMLVKQAETALCKIEMNLTQTEHRLFSIDKDADVNSSLNIFSVWTYGRCFRICFTIVGLAGLALSILPYYVTLSLK